MTGKKQGAEIHAVQRWSPSRIGADAPESLIRLYEKTFGQTLALHGLSHSPFSESSEAAGQREALRTALHTLLEPLARLAEEELGRVLETEVKFDFGPIAGVDVQSRARSVKAMVDAGVSLDAAMALAGWISVRCAVNRTMSITAWCA